VQPPCTLTLLRVNAYSSDQSEKQDFSLSMDLEDGFFIFEFRSAFPFSGPKFPHAFSFSFFLAIRFLAPHLSHFNRLYSLRRVFQEGAIHVSSSCFLLTSHDVPYSCPDHLTRVPCRLIASPDTSRKVRIDRSLRFFTGPLGELFPPPCPRVCPFLPEVIASLLTVFFKKSQPLFSRPLVLDCPSPFSLSTPFS